MHFEPLHPRLGAEVKSFCLDTEPTARQLQSLRGAFDRYHLLLFRRAEPLAPERQVSVTGWFGELLAAGDEGEMWPPSRWELTPCAIPRHWSGFHPRPVLLTPCAATRHRTVA